MLWSVFYWAWNYLRRVNFVFCFEIKRYDPYVMYNTRFKCFWLHFKRIVIGIFFTTKCIFCQNILSRSDVLKNSKTSTYSRFFSLLCNGEYRQIISVSVNVKTKQDLSSLVLETMTILPHSNYFYFEKKSWQFVSSALHVPKDNLVIG